MQGYGSIMVHVRAEGEAGQAVSLAAELARRFDARLIGIAAADVALTMSVASYGSGSAQLVTLRMAELEDKLRAAELLFRGSAGAAGEHVEWRAFTEFPATAVAREARAADLLVMSPRAGARNSSFMSEAEPGDVLMQAGRPILLVPSGLGELSASRILVAWKDRREARRAVRDALPLLARAERVQVLEICEAEESVAAARRRVADVAAYLRDHGACAEGEARLRREVSASRELAAAAAALEADLVVAGGYGHARLREWVFGGVTRDLMADPTRCCLLSH
ncbi:universal stress protein [Roseomonas sp. M0104]|uniref:Universal stress protein n=1 Tax=Teichococcus coralli TaxID=2545983 RepID=A0A845B9B8_9PROT|nr:universal stress protein [Pseudoroseomonas coralli]MXP63158.1 universal stress protein [Pseudoroseomonas coralli]